MKRSIGVTLIAVLALIGSGLTLLMGIVMAVVMSWAPNPSASDFPGPPIFFKVIMVAAVALYFFLALWGILTGIGLLRLKNWARVSIVVFSVLLVVTGAFALLPSVFFPLPSSPNNPAAPSAMAAARVFMGVFSFALLGIGVWWVVFFNRAKVKEQFGPLALSAEGITPGRTAHQRPLSITIIAWFLLSGCLFLPLNLWLHTPAVLFTKLVTSQPAAGMYYLVFGVLNLYLGIGLLRLRPMARTVGIAYFVFSFVNGAIFYFAPGGHARMLVFLAFFQSTYSWMRPWQNPALQAQSAPYLIIGAVVGLASLIVQLYFLITRKQAFLRGLPGSMSGTSQI